MTLYSYRSDGTITKFTRDGTFESSYTVSPDACTCPAGTRHTCRHRQMLPNLHQIADTHYFWDHDRGIAVDFNGVQKSYYDSIEASGLHLGEPLIEIKGPLLNQFVVVESAPLTDVISPAPSAQPWRRI